MSTMTRTFLRALLRSNRDARASGGWVSGASGHGEPLRLSRGIAIVPDSSDLDLARRLHGKDTDVYTASEWAATGRDEPQRS